MNGKYMPGFLLLLVLAILLSVSGVVLPLGHWDGVAANGFEINRWVIGGGGGRAEGGDYVLNATVGQAVVGSITSSPYELCWLLVRDGRIQGVSAAGNAQRIVKGDNVATQVDHLPQMPCNSDQFAKCS